MSTHLSRRNLVRASVLGLSAATLPAGMSGCANSDKPGGAVSPTGVAGVKKVELGQPKPGIPYPDKYLGPRAYDRPRFADGSTTFRVVVPQDAVGVGDWRDNKASAEMERRTGVRIEYEAVLVRNSDGRSDMTKINAMLASGNLPDAFFGISFSQAQLSAFGKQGLFVHLDDYIETYAPMTRQAMADYPDLRGLRVGADNKLYTMLAVNDCFHCRSSNFRAWISQPYLDKVGAAMPETTEELREVLLEFKNRNPSGKEGFMAFATSARMPIDSYFMNAFTYNPSSPMGGGGRGQWLRLNGDKIEMVANTDEWREGLKYLHQLGRDGIITRPSFTMPDRELQQLGNKGLIGFTRSYWWGSFHNPMKVSPNEPWRDYVPVPPVKGPAGVRYSGWDYYGYASGTPLVITKACKDPAALVQWGDYQMDLEATMWANFGPTPANWDWAAKGDIGVNGKQAVVNSKVFPAPAGDSWSQFAVMNRSDDFRLAQKVDPKNPSLEEGLYAVAKTYQPYAQPQAMQVPPLIVPDRDAARVADTETAVYGHVTTHLAKFTLGDLDPNSDDDWRAYVEGFTQMGVPDYLGVYQRAYETRPR